MCKIHYSKSINSTNGRRFNKQIVSRLSFTIAFFLFLISILVEILEEFWESISFEIKTFNGLLLLQFQLLAWFLRNDIDIDFVYAHISCDSNVDWVNLYEIFVKLFVEFVMSCGMRFIVIICFVSENEWVNVLKWICWFYDDEFIKKQKKSRNKLELNGTIRIV